MKLEINSKYVYTATTLEASRQSKTSSLPPDFLKFISNQISGGGFFQRADIYNGREEYVNKCIINFV